MLQVSVLKTSASHLQSLTQQPCVGNVKLHFKALKTESSHRTQGHTAFPKGHKRNLVLKRRKMKETERERPLHLSLDVRLWRRSCGMRGCVRTSTLPWGDEKFKDNPKTEDPVKVRNPHQLWRSPSLRVATTARVGTPPPSPSPPAPGQAAF